MSQKWSLLCSYCAWKDQLFPQQKSAPTVPSCVPVIIKFIVAYTFIIISTISIRKLKRHVTTALFYYMYFKQHKIQREASASLIKFIKFVNESNSYGTVKYYGTALQPHILIFFNFKLIFLVFFNFLYNNIKNKNILF